MVDGSQIFMSGSFWLAEATITLYRASGARCLQAEDQNALQTVLQASSICLQMIEDRV